MERGDREKTQDIPSCLEGNLQLSNKSLRLKRFSHWFLKITCHRSMNMNFMPLSSSQIRRSADHSFNECAYQHLLCFCSILVRVYLFYFALFDRHSISFDPLPVMAPL